MIKYIEVTEKDIAKGKARQMDSCPIALAIRRTCKTPASNVSVDEGWIEVSQQCYHVPRSVNRFIHSFDRNRPVKPFRFKFIQED